MNEWDWNFDAVPDAELVACCYWEYARESAFILDLKNRLVAWNGCGHCPEEVFLGLNRIQQSSTRTFLYLDAILEQERFPCPWQKLTRTERRHLVKLDFGLPAPFASGGDLSEAERALEGAQKQVRAYRAAVDALHRKWPGYGEGTLRRRKLWPKWELLERMFWEDGYESIMVRIAWERYTNEQIIEAFRLWVKKHRPKRFPVPSGKGHKQISQRVALERLGILRLLHQHGFSALKNQNPAAWERYNSLNRRWRKDAEKARQQFKTLFPFLENEEPRAWSPKA